MPFVSVWIVPIGRSLDHVIKYTHLDICHKWHILTWMSGNDKPIVWLEGEVETPPFTREARIEAGILLRRLQRGKYRITTQPPDAVHRA